MARRTRSTSGCLTCRKRKKKCDESSFPSCINCLHSRLRCKWPDQAEASKIKPASDPARAKPLGFELSTTVSPVAGPVDSASYSLIDFEQLRCGVEAATAVQVEPGYAQAKYPPERVLYPIDGRNKVAKPEKRGKRYFLERISMQQDCVDDDEIFAETAGAATADLLSGPGPFTEKGPDMPGPLPYLAGPYSIRELIAQQLEISEAALDPLDKGL